MNYSAKKQSNGSAYIPVFSVRRSEGLLLENIAERGGASIVPRQQAGTRVFQKQTRAAFTLIETLVAVTVLMMAILGPLTLVQKSISSASSVRDEITVSYLAQEAIEFVRNRRDENNLGGKFWFTTLDQCTSPNGSIVCGIDPNVSGNQQVISCAANGCLLYFDRLSGVYTHATTPTPSIFSRRISITTPAGGSANEAIVSVVMSWQSGTLPARTFTLSEHILNWLK